MPAALNDYRVLVRSADGSRNYPKTVRATSEAEARAIVADFGEQALEMLPPEPACPSPPTPAQSVVTMSPRELRDTITSGVFRGFIKATIYITLFCLLLLAIQLAFDNERRTSEAATAAEVERERINREFQQTIDDLRRQAR